MSVDFPPFRPHPIIRGGHLQTIAGAYLPHGLKFEARIHRVLLSDGDALALHDDSSVNLPLPLGEGRGEGIPCNTAIEPRTAIPVALLLHGLAGSHQSGYMLRVSAKLRAKGIRVFRLDLRGCGAGIGLARHPLNAGRSEDAAAALDFVHHLCPEAPIHLIGFSMGGNIVLKLAGELAQNPPRYLASVIAVSPPIDLAQCTRQIQRGLNRIYDRAFVKALIKHIAARNELVPDAHSRPLVPSPRRLMDFDSLFTAPLSGFADVYDYYSRASSGPLLPKISVPTLIITAASDPIVPIACFEQAAYSPTTQLLIASCGGHLGFIAAKNHDPDLRWLDWRTVDWIESMRPTRSGPDIRLPYPR
jgi:predicted alpha/beta-fold hydrolase